MQIYFSLLVAVIGVLMYALCVNPKLQEIGRLAFGCGLLAFLLNGVGPIVSLMSK
jgi:Na+/phosphate symporter